MELNCKNMKNYNLSQIKVYNDNKNDNQMITLMSLTST